MVVLPETTVACMMQTGHSTLFPSEPGLNDVLNEIIWMKSLSEIAKTIIAAGGIAVVAVVLFSILQCFLGYTVFRYELAIIGAAGLGAATYVVGNFILHWTGAKLIAATAFAAFMGAGMLFNVSAIMVFLIAVGSITFALMMNSAKYNWDLLPQVIIIIAVTTGVVCLILYKHVIIIGNAVMGAGTLGILLATMFESDVVGYVFGGVFGLLGLITQYVMLVRKKRREKEKDAKWEAQRLAKKTKMLDDEVPGVPKAESVDLTDVFPTQSDMERRLQQRQTAREMSYRTAAERQDTGNVARRQSTADVTRTQDIGNVARRQNIGNVARRQSTADVARQQDIEDILRQQSTADVARTQDIGNVARRQSTADVARQQNIEDILRQQNAPENMAGRANRTSVDIGEVVRRQNSMLDGLPRHNGVNGTETRRRTND